MPCFFKKDFLIFKKYLPTFSYFYDLFILKFLIYMTYMYVFVYVYMYMMYMHMVYMYVYMCIPLLIVLFTFLLLHIKILHLNVLNMLINKDLIIYTCCNV